MPCRHQFLLLFSIMVLLFGIPAASGLTSDATAQSETISPEVVQIGVYVEDFNEFKIDTGTIDATFYLTLRSDTNVSFNDIEIMNGHATSVDTILDSPNNKEYKIVATLTVDPDLHRFPFDLHTAPIEIEPKLQNEKQMAFVIDQTNSGLDTEANLPGWELAGTSTAITNKTYIPGEIPYSRAVFEFGIERDAASTILKFFLPIMLIIVVALSSLMIKISSRLGLNASMFLAAVLIHWRVADSIPLVAYATFLDLFMMITYATLVMVLVSGLLILKFTESKDQEHIGSVNRWSIRIIPTISLTLFSVLFLTLLF
jgi:hypothetical protein